MTKSFRKRYPPPWRVESTPAGFKVVDANGQAVAYTYAEQDPGKAKSDLMSITEAKTMAQAIAALGNADKGPRSG